MIDEESEELLYSLKRAVSVLLNEVLTKSLELSRSILLEIGWVLMNITGYDNEALTDILLKSNELCEQDVGKRGTLLQLVN